MAKRTEQRINDRNGEAAAYREDQGVVAHAVSGVGLKTANALDRLTAPIDDDRVRFLGGTFTGFLRGAIYGALFTVLTIAFVPAVAVYGIPLALGAMALGSVCFGIYDGQKEFEDNLHRGPTLSDRIAQKTGAVLSPDKGFGKTADAVLREAGMDPNLAREVEKTVAEVKATIPYDDIQEAQSRERRKWADRPLDSWVATEDARKEQQAARQNQPN